jgi:peptidyl-prolyl cis-trans isomerase C
MIKTKYASLFIIGAASIAFCAGCSKEEEANSTDAEAIQATDLFEKPVQSNPLEPQAEDVVITVNGEKITYGQIVQTAQQIAQRQFMRIARQVPPQQQQQVYQQFMYRAVQDAPDMIINNVLLTQAAEKSSLVVSDEDLSEAVAEETVQIINYDKSSRMGRDQATDPALYPDRPVDEILAEAEITMDELKDSLRKRLLLDKFVEAQTADLAEASDADAAEFYKSNPEIFKTLMSYTASHILLQTSGLSDEEKAAKKEELKKIRADIIAGTMTFEEAAQQYSDDPGSKDNGGEYADVPPGQMVPEFEKAAITTELGEISEIVETNYGYHIIRPRDQQVQVHSFEDVVEKLKSDLTAQKKDKALAAYVDMLREKAEIVRLPPNMDAGAMAE